MPFTVQQFLNSIASYNEAIWPAQIVLVALAVAAIAIVWTERRAPLVTLSLATLWAWIGVVYQYRFFAPINPAAYLFAAVFLMQAALLIWYGSVRGWLRLQRPTRNTRGVVGTTMIAYSLLVYPTTAWFAGHAYPEMPTFGLPCPVLIFTFGLFVLAESVPWQLMVIPVLWSVVGTSAAMQLGMVEDFALLPAALIALTFQWRGRSMTHTGVRTVD